MKQLVPILQEIQVIKHVTPEMVIELSRQIMDRHGIEGSREVIRVYEDNGLIADWIKTWLEILKDTDKNILDKIYKDLLKIK